MSTSDLYRVYKTKATAIAEYRNGWGSAPLIWGYLNERYLGGARHAWMTGDKRLWDLVYDDRVPRSVRLAHAFTFDRAVCPPKKAVELADALEEAGRICANEQHVNHWSAIAADLRVHKAKPRQIGVALSCTSVSDPWISYEGGGELWDVFSVLKGAPEKATVASARGDGSV